MKYIIFVGLGLAGVLGLCATYCGHEGKTQ